MDELEWSYTWYKYTDYAMPLAVVIITVSLAMAIYIHWRFK